MKKEVYLFLSFLLLTFMSFAQETVSRDEAIKMAKHFISNKIDDTSDDTAKTNVIVNGSDTILYEVIIGKKSTIIPGIKICKPILAYLDNPQGGSVFDSESLATNGHGYFIRKYIDQIQNCLDSGDDYKIHPGWNHEAINTNDTKSTNDTIINPLLSSRWGQSVSNDGRQSNAYNYFISSTRLFGGDTCPTGCIATAMGQIMNYWKYPVYKTGNVYQYDWCNMVDELRVDRPNYIKERNAVARLLADCGDAVGMDYCMPLNVYDGSFAWPQYARDAFVEDFGYSDNATIIRRFEGGYSDSDWKDRIVRPLMSGYPVFYAAIEDWSVNGHAFVCDGYRSTDGLFHFNFGWTDDDQEWRSNWYSLENITPESNQQYNTLERAIIWLHPGEDDVFCDYTLDLTRYYNDNIYNGIVQEFPFYFVPATYANLLSSREHTNAPVSWRTIPSGESSEYVAHKSVTLQPGFHAERGSTFSARIVPCSNCDSEEMSSLTQQTMMPGGGNSEDSSMLGKSVVTDSNNEEMSDNRLFPNPSHETITYQGKKVASMGIYDMTGKAVYRWFIVSKTENEIVVNIKDLRPSMYVLLLNMSDGTREVVRFIKE